MISNVLTYSKLIYSELSEYRIYHYMILEFSTFATAALADMAYIIGAAAHVVGRSKMCQHRSGKSCQKCQEKVAVESLLSISQSSFDASGVMPLSQSAIAAPVTPPPSFSSGRSVISEAELSDDSCNSVDILSKHLKRKSRLAEVSFFLALPKAIFFIPCYFSAFNAW